jgi:hypothetical protein
MAAPTILRAEKLRNITRLLVSRERMPFEASSTKAASSSTSLVGSSRMKKTIMIPAIMGTARMR